MWRTLTRNEVLMKQKCESIIIEQLQEIRSEHGMKEYLTMLARFPQMGYENVLLLMHLFPEAMMVCGKGAWKNYQADIKAGERAIPLLCPLGAVGDMTKVSYGVVGVFDISQVQNRETIHIEPVTKACSVEHIWKENYSYVVLEDINGEYIRSRLLKSTVNEDEHTIYLRKGLSEESREAELLKLYVKMRVKKAEVTVFEEELCDYLQIVMKRYFCCISEQDGKVRYSELFVSPEDEFRGFLRSLSIHIIGMISELTGQNFLSFIETALCNIFFEPEELAETVMHVMDAAERTDTEEMQQELLAFSNRVSAMTQEEYQMIRGLRNKQQLFSFPMPNYRGTR